MLISKQYITLGCIHRHALMENFVTIVFFSLRIFLLGIKLHMAWQQNLANAMARPRKLQHNTTKKIKSG